MFSCGSILIEVINFSNAFSRSLILAPHEFACKPNLSLHNLTAISEWALPYWKVTKYNHRKEPNECHLKQNHIEQKCSKIDKYHFKRNNHEKSNYFQSTTVYGSVSAGREKWPFNVLFFLKVEPPCDQT